MMEPRARDRLCETKWIVYPDRVNKEQQERVAKIIETRYKKQVSNQLRGIRSDTPRGVRLSHAAATIQQNKQRKLEKRGSDKIYTIEEAEHHLADWLVKKKEYDARKGPKGPPPRGIPQDIKLFFYGRFGA
jgi:succinyl-CoA synthetase alpha subunit